MYTKYCSFSNTLYDFALNFFPPTLLFAHSIYDYLVIFSIFFSKLCI